jgi:hypothetical protein
MNAIITSLTTLTIGGAFLVGCKGPDGGPVSPAGSPGTGTNVPRNNTPGLSGTGDMTPANQGADTRTRVNEQDVADSPAGPGVTPRPPATKPATPAPRDRAPATQPTNRATPAPSPAARPGNTPSVNNRPQTGAPDRRPATAPTAPPQPPRGSTPPTTGPTTGPATRPTTR